MNKMDAIKKTIRYRGFNITAGECNENENYFDISLSYCGLLAENAVWPTKDDAINDAKKHIDSFLAGEIDEIWKMPKNQ